MADEQEVLNSLRVILRLPHGAERERHVRQLAASPALLGLVRAEGPQSLQWFHCENQADSAVQT